jgi:hypothetical protein
MRAAGAAGIDAGARVGATLPSLGWIATGLLVLGLLVLAGGAVAVVIPVQRAQRPVPPSSGMRLPGPRTPQPDGRHAVTAPEEETWRGAPR